MIADNVKRVKETIERLSQQSGEKVTLLGVTKTRSIDEIKQLISAGVSELGENRVQEFNEKYPLLEAEAPKWHIIGSLQTNKLKYIIGKVKLIQSVDSLHLAQSISDFSVKKELVSDVLLEVNVSKEECKHGFYEEELSEAVEKISVMDGVCVKGLMMMAPNVEDTAYLSDLFEKTRKIFDNLMNYNAKYDNIDISILSMGMSHDYELAVRCGSNMVRLGTTLFI